MKGQLAKEIKTTIFIALDWIFITFGLVILLNSTDLLKWGMTWNDLEQARNDLKQPTTSKKQPETTKNK